MPTRVRFRRYAFMIVAIVCALFWDLALESPRAYGQSEVASVSGRITDQSGAVVPKAEVELKNADTGISYVTKTNDEGFYSFSIVTPGNYVMNVHMQAFRTVSVTGIVLNVQDNLSRNFVLQVGSSAESITVTAGGLNINTTDATVGTVVDRQFVENLPLNGRSFQSLIELTPGVNVATVSLGSQGQFNVNGQRANSNYYTIDGVSANFGGVSESTLINAGGSLPALTAQGGTNSLVSVDAMQEFRIQTSTFAPEFGRTPGAQIAIETRSGTNNFHGNVFDYFRNNALDANNWFNDNLKLPKPGEHVNDFGGILGGPLYRNKTFFFFSYEGLRLSLPQTAETEVPGLDARAAAPAALQPLLNAFPIPNGPELTDGSMLAPFNASFSNPSKLDAYSVRIDDLIGSKWRIFGRYSDAPSNNISNDGGGFSINTRTHSDLDTRSLTVGATWLINNRMTNDLRFNYGSTRDNTFLTLDNFGGAVPPPSSALFPTVPFTTTNSTFLFLIALGTDTVFGVGPNSNNSQTQYNLVDNFSVEKGTHALKFGVDYRRLTPRFDNAAYSNVPIFLDVPSVVANLPLYTEVTTERPATVFLHNLGLYAQDTWRIRPRLTLTYGLRWDLDVAPTLSNGLNFPAVTGFGGNGSNLGIAPPGTPVFKTTYGNFAPRLGFAYQFNQTSGYETVLRGGFGIFYDLVSQDIGTAVGNQHYPLGAVNFVLGPPSGGTATFPLTPTEGQPPAVSLTLPLSVGIVFNPNLKLPYTYEYNVAVEQALGGNQSLSVSYVGATGRRLLQKSTGANLTDFTTVEVTDNTASSDYSALQVQFKRQMTQGLQVLAGYTWSHSIDTASSNSFGGQDDVIILGQNPNVNRGPSDFDIRNSGSLGLTYAIPNLHGSFLRRNVLGGWSVDTLALAYSAPPLTVIDENLQFPAAVTVRPDVVPGVPLYLHGSQYPGGKTINSAAFQDPPVTIVNGVPTPVRQGTLPRNSLRGLGLKQWDFSLHRDFRLRETLDLQFRAEMFNIVNHPNFGGFNTVFTTPSQPTFGQATETLAQSLGGGGSVGGFTPLFQIGGPRSIQLALKLIF